MARSVAIRCPNCGASSFEETGGGERSCSYCRTSFHVSTPDPPVAHFPPPPPKYTPPPKPLIVRLGQAVFVIFAVAFFCYILISMFLMDSNRKEFDKRFEENRKEIEEKWKETERPREGWPW
jgi:hypothetical protein